MSIKIRKATTDDSSFLATMILQSSRAGKKIGIFDLIFEVEDSIILERLIKLINTESKSHCHFTNFLIAEIDTKQVGTLCSFEPRIATQDTFVKALKEIGCEKELTDLLEVMSCCDFELNNRTLMFDFMEEIEGMIDVGILKTLMQKSLLTARLKGYRIGQTLVEIGSLETIMFYKKLGFRIVREKESELYKEKFGRAGLILLELEF